MQNCIFCRIISHEIESRIAYEDALSVAIYDINPQAPLHVLIIPREHIESLAQIIEERHLALLGHLLIVANKIYKQLCAPEEGFRLVLNCGERAGQSVPHLHIHMLSGRVMRWPPG